MLLFDRPPTSWTNKITRERGWNVLALDPRSFRIHGLYTQACGGKPYLRNRSTRPVLDITNICETVQDSSSTFYSQSPPFVRELEENKDHESSFPDIFDDESSIGKDGRYNIINQNHSTNSSPKSYKDIATVDHGNDVTQQTPGDAVGVPPVSFDSLIDFLEDMPDEIEYEGSEFSMDTDGDDDLELEDFDLPPIPDFLDEAVAYIKPETIVTAEYASEDIPISQKFKGNAFMDFPILHFSETDIRLLENPSSLDTSVVCAGPLRQDFSYPIYTIDGFDRFNMVKYLPEDGIVIAATQKGRAAIISLGRVFGGGLTLRINWMVPLFRQERFGERPLMPLLGIAVSPIQGFEKTADVPDVPYRATSPDDVSFHYRFHDKEEDDWCENISSWGKSARLSDEEDEQGYDSSEASGGTSGLTYAECHGAANWTYQSSEPWQGWNPSRRYRLLLTYADHTVLSYEFWYEWSEAVLKDYCITRGKYPDDGCDDFLLL